MIVQNKKTGQCFHISEGAWELIKLKGMGKRYSVLPDDLPPIPAPPMPEELTVKCCGGAPCLNDCMTEERDIEEPITIQDIEGDTPAPKKRRKTTIE